MPQPKQTDDRMNRIYRMDSVLGRHGDGFVSIEPNKLLPSLPRFSAVRQNGVLYIQRRCRAMSLGGTKNKGAPAGMLYIHRAALVENVENLATIARYQVGRDLFLAERAAPLVQFA